MRFIDGDIPVWGNPIDEESIKQIIRCRKGAYKAALMADHHKGYSVPIGGVVAYKNSISPSGVGFDIACGNKAVLTDINWSQIKDKVGTIMDDIYANISFGIGRKNSETVDHELFSDDAWNVKVASDHKTLASQQLGTVGSGNHYVDLLVDEKDRVWVGVHFGSRGFGHKMASYFLEAGGAKDDMDAPPLVIPVDSPLGSDYIACMNLAGRYAYAGRDWVCQKVVSMLGAKILDEVHNHHNFAWKENHLGEDLWVIRKGATPAFPGQKGFVGGSMGDNAVILQGVKFDSLSMNSTVHGAGRVMSRTQAAGKLNRKTKERSGGMITNEMMNEWLHTKGVVLRGGGTDEAPQAYKRLPEVLREHADSIKILHTLKPVGVAMAGINEYDPYKD